MKKTLLTAFSFSVLASAIAQPNCIIVGPAYSFGNTSFENYTFNRQYNLVDNTPQYTFSNFGNQSQKSKNVGLMMDVYKPHSRIAFDLMIPLKGTTTNVFNFNLAFGGYIKEKIGIMIGGSYYANAKFFNADLPTASALELTNDMKASGDFYNNNFMATGLGANALLNIALSEQFVIRLDYGIYNSDIATKKMSQPNNADWKQSFSRKYEASLCWQVEGEPFGIALKYSSWTTIGQYYGDYEYLDNSNATQTINMAVLPERKYVLNNFMIAIMLPLGNMTSTTGTITVIN